MAGNADAALAVCETLDPEVALLDVQLPGSDGLELLDRLLRVRPETLVLDDYRLRHRRERRGRVPPRRPTTI